MTSPLRTAPIGSPELLDAVEATFDTLTDEEFAAIMRGRPVPEVYYQPGSPAVRAAEAKVRAQCRPLFEPTAEPLRPAVVGESDKYTVPTAPEQRRVA